MHDSPSGSNIFVVQIDKDRVPVNIFIFSFLSSIDFPHLVNNTLKSCLSGWLNEPVKYKRKKDSIGKSVSITALQLNYGA